MHKGTRRHRHMLVLDLNGLLVDRRMSPFENPVDGTKVAPDAKFGKFYIYNRPHMQSFVEEGVGTLHRRGLVVRAAPQRADAGEPHMGQATRPTGVRVGPGQVHARRRHGPRARAKPPIQTHLTQRLTRALGRVIVREVRTEQHPAPGRLPVQGGDEPSAHGDTPGGVQAELGRADVTAGESDLTNRHKIADELLGPNGAPSTYLPN